MALLKTFTMASVILLLQTFGYSQNGKVLRLSLQEALGLAKTSSYQIQIAASELEQAKGQNLESLSGFLPHVSVSENYIRSNDPVTVFSLKLKQGIFAQQDFALETLNNPDALDNFTTSFQVQQPLLNLDAIYGKSAASLGVKARKEAFKRAQEAVFLHVKKGYFGLILARQNVTAIRESMASAEAHRDDAKAAMEQGMINEADYLAAEVRVAELQEQLISAEHQIANASDGLKFVIGIEDESLVVPTDTLSVPSSIQDAENLDEQIASRSDLQALQFQSKAAHRNVWMKRSGWIPRVNAFGAVEWNASRALSSDASNWALGFQLQWKFFEGFGIFGRSKQATAEAEKVEVQVRQAEEQAKMEVRKAWRAVEATEKRIRVAESAVKQAEESHRIAQERFREGLEKTSDLLDKEVALTNAKLRLLKARHDYTVAVSELEFALGK
ncbi:TolC family protein [candidate division KSB1 bacterium]|nr:TolC family protein [candidate division KSB1 bacterium]